MGQGTTLRLVGGPVMTNPVLEVPSAAPGQALEVDLEVTRCPMNQKEMPELLEAFYCLVTPCGQPFGEVFKMQVATPKEETPPSLPVCVVAASPCDGLESGLEALQGELKTVEWTLANVGSTAWPE